MGFNCSVHTPSTAHTKSSVHICPFSKKLSEMKIMPEKCFKMHVYTPVKIENGGI